MNIHAFENDPRLSLFLNMRDRDIRRETPYFLAEGEQVVRRAFGAGLKIKGVLVAHGKADRVVAMAEAAGQSGVEVLACDKTIMQEAVGFALHQGIVAAVEVPPAVSLDEVCASKKRLTLAVCPEVTNVDNLGLMMRVCAGLGVDAILLGEQSADPWYRRAVRVSMGAVFKLPIVRSADVVADLARLRDAHGYETLATVIDAEAPALRDVKIGADRLAVLFGSEGYGLSHDMADACDHKVRIPMHHDVDSLNIAVAAGIVLHEVGQR